MKNGRHYLRGEHFFYEEELGNPKQRVCPSQNMDERLMHIDYSDRRFEPGEDQVIFGVEADNLNWV